ncbi:MAG: response regulator transcription factor [Candidatus Nanopelagicales bacterium]|jgi:two-component system OmpR family response regulator|nr:response regulator transcription factor [Candidatus Nanopelagicales bacterium]
MSNATAEPRVLVVDDEENVAFLISSALRLAGYETLVASTGIQAVEDVGRFAPHVIVLDVMLPDVDGFEVLRRIRTGGSQAPVLFVTARGATTDRVRGLTSGGDDYIVKPFELEELVARVQVAVRRSGVGARSSRLAVGDLSMDLDAHRVWRGEVEAHLTATEFTLLRVLLANAGRVVTREQILDAVWQYDFNGESSIIESFIRNLRRKVDAVEPKLIHTVRGVGYTIREP